MTLGCVILAMRDLLDLPSEDPDLIEAREIAHQQGPISTVLENMTLMAIGRKPDRDICQNIEARFGL